MKTVLVIMAAGIGSRFGGGIKQLTPVGPSGELIIDYSVYDAIEAGFDKIIFIIRKDIEADFKEIIGNRLEEAVKEKGIEIAYAYQDINNIPEGFEVPKGRTKPWGTGQAVLACKGMIHEPFAVINADDYYGKEAFVKIHDYLVGASKAHQYCMAGFILENTLSDNGGVTRGICVIDENGHLIGVNETSNIIKTSVGAEADGASVDEKSHVSMNMWGLTPEFIDILDQGFGEFLENLNTKSDVNPEKAEYLLPIIIDQLIKEERATVAMLETPDKWFGVTYAADKESVAESFRQLVEEGKYQSPLL